jgi:hypothetical protein
MPSCLPPAPWCTTTSRSHDCASATSWSPVPASPLLWRTTRDLGAPVDASVNVPASPLLWRTTRDLGAPVDASVNMTKMASSRAAFFRHV